MKYSDVRAGHGLITLRPYVNQPVISVKVIIFFEAVATGKPAILIESPDSASDRPRLYG